MLNVAKSNMLLSVDDVVDCVEDSLSERKNEAIDLSDQEIETAIESQACVIVDNPDDKHFVVFDDKIYADDKENFLKNEDGSYSWSVPESVTLSNTLGYNAHSCNEQVSADIVVSDYRKACKINNRLESDRVRASVVNSLSGESVNSVPYIVYPEEMSRVTGAENGFAGIKTIALPPERTNDGLFRGFIDVRADTPYDFRIREYEFRKGSDSEKVYNVLALPDFKPGKQYTKTMMDNPEHMDCRDCIYVCDDGQTPSDRFSAASGDFARIARYSKEIMLENSTDLSDEERETIRNGDAFSSVTRSVHFKYLDNLDKSLECISVNVPAEIKKDGREEYYVPSAKGDSVLRAANSSGTFKVQKLSFTDHENAEQSVYSKIYFGDGYSKLCLPANMPLADNGYTISDFNSDVVKFNNLDKVDKYVKSRFEEAVKMASPTRVAKINDISPNTNQERANAVNAPERQSGVSTELPEY